eukprot:CAMPEP_0195302294 /NCGR_PEP_ID=MMETSP0707-20130614/30840_1 /TAXON_ID=33640 /ORGANISM="Asterionellopsis glacialis, Strain CCMP134" /LENGTH=1068 /DNA_ID=CAMNT_0040365501 /DNA_START=82 /DNA_END=3288 /DNA_ORIENTATION=-
MSVEMFCFTRRIAILLCFVVGFANAAVETTDVYADQTLNVHIVPHTHDDVGWLKTVEQYYYGQNSTIQDAFVQSIITTVVEELVKNPKRKFTYVEQKFFSVWWAEQSDQKKATVRELVRNRQLAFVNGGWCMHDEAATHFMGMIDQTTLGHTFLKEELGVIPTVGWQLDPFGHSATQASLFTAKLGFNALYFGRIDYQDLQIRQDTQECEGLWSSSPNLDETVFWGLTGEYQGNYGAPSGFCFEPSCEKDHLVGLDDKELLLRIKDFLKELKEQSDRTKDNNIMLTMGSDFQYKKASINYQNLDLLIDSVVRFQSSGEIDISSVFDSRFDHVNIFYSNPEIYTNAKYTAEVTHQTMAKDTNLNVIQTSSWSMKTDDFFPYADCPHCYWTGYFTSRASLKRLERIGSSFLLAARQIESVDDKMDLLDCDIADNCRPLYELDDAMGVLQHHDGVSGTAKQHVSDDYSKRVHIGFGKALTYVETKLKHMLLKNYSGQTNVDFRSCHMQNHPSCDDFEISAKDIGNDIFIIVYNGLAARRSTVVGVPVSVQARYQVSILSSSPLEADEEEVIVPSALFPQVTDKSSSVVYFDTGPLPPVGASVFRLKILNSIGTILGSSNELARESALLRGAENPTDLEKEEPDSLELSNGFLTVHFNSSTGAIESIATVDGEGLTVDVTQDWGYYSSFDTKGEQKSGAYIFRPRTPREQIHTILPKAGKAKFHKTDLVMEVSMEFEQPWVKQVTRLYYGQPYVEIEYTIGPIPIEDCVGKEIITRYTSSAVESNEEFYTDSNGREFLQRRRSFRPSWDLQETEFVSGNYYPVNAAAYIEGDKAALAVVVDRSQGASSLADGCLEFMVQRRVLEDDGRGVGEPLNETCGGVTPYPPYGNATRVGEGVVITGKHRLLVGGGLSGASLARSQMDKVFSEPLVFVASTEADSDVPFKITSFSALQNSLPGNVMLVTFSVLQKDPSSMKFLIRLGHQYGKGEDTEMSKPVDINLCKLFADYEVITIVEKTLSGNQDYSDWEKNRMNWDGSDPKRVSTATRCVIELSPMDIRTFEMEVGKSILEDIE